MESIQDNDLFWKIMRRNKGKTILIDLPEKWVKIVVDDNGAIGTEIQPTLQDVGISQNQFERFQDSESLKLALSDVFDNYNFQKAFVVENQRIKREVEEE